MDALKYKHPRHESQSLSTPALFKYLYAIQSNSVWEWLLFLSGWIFFCFAAFDSEVYATKVGVQASILIIFWIDTVILLYCKTYDHFTDVNKYSKFFIFKITIFTLMTIDLIVLICLPCYDSRPIRPFRILRCCKILLIQLCRYCSMHKCENLCCRWLRHIRTLWCTSSFSLQLSWDMRFWVTER